MKTLSIFRLQLQFHFAVRIKPKRRYCVEIDTEGEEHVAKAWFDELDHAEHFAAVHCSWAVKLDAKTRHCRISDQDNATVRVLVYEKAEVLVVTRL